MTRLRSLAAAVSPSGLVVPVVLTALLAWQSMSNITWEFDQAHRCAVDWQLAIEALEGGATEYHGNCVGLSIGPDQEIPEDFYEQVEMAHGDFASATERLTSSTWQTAARHVGGAPLVFFALFLGAMASGGPLGSATAAWGLSNGWTRPVWARSAITLTGLAVVSVFALLTATGVLLIYTKVTGAGVGFDFPSPVAAALLPLPGLFFYGLVGVLAGLLTGRGEIGGMVAVAVAIADFMASSRFELSPLFPMSWHQTVLGAEVSPMTEGQAVAAAMAAAVVLAVVAYWYMTRRRDVPDR